MSFFSVKLYALAAINIELDTADIAITISLVHRLIDRHINMFDIKA